MTATQGFALGGDLLGASENAFAQLINAGIRYQAGTGIQQVGDKLGTTLNDAHGQYEQQRIGTAGAYAGRRNTSLQGYLDAANINGNRPNVSLNAGKNGPVEGVGQGQSLALQNYAKLSGDLRTQGARLSKENDQQIQLAQRTGTEMLDAYKDQTSQGIAEFTAGVESQKGVGTDLTRLPPDDELVQLKNQFGVNSPEFKQAMSAREAKKMQLLGDKHTQLRTQSAAQEVQVIAAARGIEQNARQVGLQLKSQFNLSAAQLTSNAAAGAVRAALDDSQVQLGFADLEMSVIGANEASHTQALIDSNADYVNAQLIPAEYQRAGWQTIAGIQFQPAGWGRAISDAAQSQINSQQSAA